MTAPAPSRIAESVGSRARRDYRVSFVMPAYDEVENIEEAVTRAVQALGKYASEFEVVVVDDGSTDGTGTILDGLARSIPAVRALHHERNLGYGSALRTGFAAAKYDMIFYTDADNQFDVDEIKVFLPLGEQFDIVTGFRVYRYDPIVRCFLSWGFNRLCRLIFRTPVQDVDCAFKLFRRNVFDAFELESRDFFIDAEILAKARTRGFSIHEVGVKHFPRKAGRTTIRGSDIPRTLRELLRIWISIHFRKTKSGHANEDSPGDVPRAGGSGSGG